jgi:hypothetical protein
MMAWIHEQLSFLEDPYTLLVVAPVLFGVIYIVTSFFGERG